MFKKILMSLATGTVLTGSTTAIVEKANIKADQYDLAITESIYQGGVKNEYWTTEKADTFNIIEKTYELVQNFNYSVIFANSGMATDFMFNSKFEAKDILTAQGQPLDKSMFKAGNTLNLMFNFSYVYDSSSKIKIILI